MADGDATKGMLAVAQESFRRRIKYYMQKGATAVIGELGTTPGHALRKTYADSVLAGTASIYEMAVAVATNTTVVGKLDALGGHSGVPDSDLEFTVNSMWDDFSGFEAP